MEQSLRTVNNVYLNVNEGPGAFSRGMKAVGYIVDVNRKAQNTYKVRIPALHGWCDLDGKNCEDPHFSNDDLPTIGVATSLSTPTGVIGSNTPKLAKGDCVLVEFQDNEWRSPIIVNKLKPHATLGDGEYATNSDLLQEVLIEQVDGGPKVDDPDRGCGIIITKSATIPDNGTTVGGADKCGSAGKIADGFTANIADLMKIIQDTDGKIGSQFVNKYTGELFEITAYIQKYTASILGVIRSSIAWIKAEVTKYVRKAIDRLVKAIMQPIKGVTKIVDETLEKALEQIACSFGDLESIISNMIEDLLNALVDSTLNVVFGCLDTLVDGILNEILSQVTSLVEDILGGISAIAGLIGGFGDLIGGAINAVLDFLGISCGGAGDCTASGEQSFIYKFNTPGEYGVPSSVTKALDSGLSAIDGISQGIVQGKNGVDAANQKAAEYAAGVELGGQSESNITTTNEQLSNALSTAEGLLSGVNQSIQDFCNGAEQPTTAVVVGSEINPTSDTQPGKYDSVYVLTSNISSVDTGGSITYTITRNNTKYPGIINFVAFKSKNDNVRLSGNGVKGDVNTEVSLSKSDFGAEKINKRTYPSMSSVFNSKSIIFKAGEKKKKVTIKTNSLSSPSSTTDRVTFTASIYRSSADINSTVYVDKNIPNSSPSLNTITSTILFSIPASVVSGTTPPLPPGMTSRSVYYSSSDLYVQEGNTAVLLINRSPSDIAKTQLRVTTSNVTAINGVHYQGTSSAGNIVTFDPNNSSKSGIQLSIPTYSGQLNNQALQFAVILEDNLLPVGVVSNVGSTGSTNSLGQSQLTGSGSLKYYVTITPSGIGTNPPSLSSGNTCVPEIVFTEQPPSCIVQYEDDPLSIGLIARTTVAGYDLSYKWETTYVPSSGWVPVNNGSYTKTVQVQETDYGILDSGLDVFGNPYVISGWTTSIVPRTATCVFSGSTTNQLSINPLDYRINDQQYFRCLVTATPTVSSYTTPILSAYSEEVYLGVNADGVFASPVLCSPTVPSGTIITYSGYTAAVPGEDVPTSISNCESLPVVVLSGITNIQINQPYDDGQNGDDGTDGTGETGGGSGTGQNGDDSSTVPTTDDEIEPVEEIDDTVNGFPVIPVVVGPDGGVNSIPLPTVNRQYKFPPLIAITGAGVGATAQSILDSSGFIQKIVVKSRGFGYNTDAKPDLCGILDSIEIQNPGGYHTSSPTVYVNGDSSIAVAAIDDNGRVVEVRITNPQNKVFDKIPRIEIVGGSGYGVAAIAVMRYVDCAKVADEYLNVVNKYNTSKLGTVRVVDCP